MNCIICHEEITYDPPNTNKGHGIYFTVSQNEMTWGENSIYPLETYKAQVCCIGCLIEWCKKWI
jgi:hypothetical protein